MAFDYLIGIDEVGRGPIAGPLCVGACKLTRDSAGLFFKKVRGIKDSKQLLPQERDVWAAALLELEVQGCIRTSVSFVSEKVIDEGGLARALHHAVGAVLSLVEAPKERSFILLDGTLRAPREYLFQESVIGGDENDPLIAAASIVAKVRRDRYMTELSREYPLYGFDEHKGYGTPGHYKALRKYGPCEVHRKSFLRGFPTIRTTN